MNIEKLEVAEIMLQETIAGTTEIVYAGWLDDVARGTPKDLAADRSCEDATQVNASDHEEGVRATTPIKAFRITLSMVATKGIEKEQHHSTSGGWRSMTAWNEHETDKCWEEGKNILMGELNIGLPTTYVSENHGYMSVHRGISFPSSGSDAESNGTGCVRMAHSDTKIMPRIKPTWFDGEMMGKRNSCRGRRWSLQGSEWESNSKHVEHMARLWRLKLAAEDLTKEIVLSTVGERACCDARPSRISLTHRKSESHGTVRRLPEMASSWRVRVALPEMMGGSLRTVLTSKQTSQILEQIGTGAEVTATSGNSAICGTCEGKHRSRVWQNLTTEGLIQEARHKNETQLKSEDKILNRTPKQKRTRQSR